jgi:hypothetical protein
MSTCAVTIPTQALALFDDHDLVIDATADQRATSLLWWAAEAIGKPFVTACVQREGGIARADRLPLRPGEQHLPPVPPGDDEAAPALGLGCGDVVSLTPPSAVVAAAELAVELVRDELLGATKLPPSLVRVLDPQPDTPYEKVGTLTPAVVEPDPA